MSMPMKLVTETSRAKPMHVKFTEASLRDWPLPAAGRTMIYDTETPGLALRITPNGAKAFYFYAKVNGRPTKKRLGVLGALTLKDAQRVVKQKNGVAAGGDNPFPKHLGWQALTFGEAFERFITNHKAHRSDVRQDRQRFDLYLKGIAAKPLKDIIPDDVQEIHNRVAKLTSGTTANRVLALISATFNKVTGKVHNPARAVERYDETPRDRFLSKSEIAALVKALDKINPDVADVVRLALLTGARRGNLIAMKWADINLADAEWRIPGEEMKAGKPITIPLAPDAVALLTKRQAAGKRGAAYVFPGVGGEGHLVDIAASWNKLIELAKLPGVRFHDLRRTYASYLAMSGAPAGVTQKALGHLSSITTAKHYVNVAVDAVRKASVGGLALMLGTEGEAAK